MPSSVLLAKVCTKCGQEKPLDGFAHDRTYATGKDGRHPWCRECRLERTRQWRLANKEQYRQSYLQYYQDNKEQHKARTKERSRRVRAENAEQQREKTRRYYATNRERCRMYGRLGWARRQARMAAVPDTLIAEEISCLFSVQEGRCFYCEEVVALTIDHIIPFAAKNAMCGGNVLKNVVGACLSCNSSKNTMSVELWLARSERQTISLEEFEVKRRQLWAKIGENSNG